MTKHWFRCLLLGLLAQAVLPGGALAAVLIGPIVNPANGHRYYKISFNTWAGAEAEAITLGGHLVTINDDAENTWVWNTFAPGPFWIGLTDAAQEGTFVWTSGEPATFFKWWCRSATDCEPNGGSTENFVEMNNFVWNDNSAMAVFTAVVEVPGLLRNGQFDNGLAGWLTFATPTPNHIVASVISGVLNFYREAPPAGTSNQATVYQETGIAVAPGRSLVARFDLGNSSTVRKRISVLIINSTFSDVTICTFWLQPGTPLRTYGMRTHTTFTWTNAAIYFYAASAGSFGGAYQIDNVTLVENGNGSTLRTDCLDPLAPVPTGGSASADLLTNGDLNTGSLTPWDTFGTISQQISNGVLQFIRPSTAPPAGVVLQPTGQAIASGTILTATLSLGNSSPVWKRATVILHDRDFTDLSACMFWIAPNQPLSPYTVRTYATQAWTDATIAVYPSLGAELWILLDDVALRRTPAETISGTDCIEPGGELDANAIAQAGLRPDAATASASWRLPPPSGEAAVMTAGRAGSRRVKIRLDAETPASVQVSLDGVTWFTVHEVAPAANAVTVEVDLSAFAGEFIYVRLIVERVERGGG